MADPSAFDVLRIPSSALIALDWRPYHFALQPYHYLVRATHVLTMAAFFGGIMTIDLRLMGFLRQISLRTLTDKMATWLYGTFAVTFVTGLALFLYDPVHVGSHAYFSLKLFLTFLGLANAAAFHHSGQLLTSALDPSTQWHVTCRGRFAGALSLALWIGVVVCASLNVEAEPKVLLR
jgi:hypothetical protein